MKRLNFLLEITKLFLPELRAVTLKSIAGILILLSCPLSATALPNGELQVMAWEGYDLFDQLSDWKKDNGITTTTISITSQDDVHVKFMGGNPLPIDIAEYNQAYANLYMDELKIAQKIDLTKIPNYNADNIFPELFDKPEWTKNGNQWGIPWVWGFNTLLYNPKFTDAPTSYNDLLDPKFKGKIAIADDTVSTWPVAARIAGYGDKFPNLTHSELKEVFDNFKKFRDQSRLVVMNMGDTASLLASGELYAALVADPNIVNIAAEQGVELAMAIPKEGPVLWVDSWFIPASADNAEAAHAFMNASLDPKVQAEAAMAVNQFPVSPEAVKYLDEASRQRIDYANLGDVFAAGLPGIPPVKDDGVHATYDDWVEAWEGFKAGL